MQDNNQKPKISKGNKIKFISVTIFFLVAIIMIITEIVLGFTKYQSTYDKMKAVSFTQAKWWTYDSTSGPRYVPNQLDAQDSIFFKNERWYYNRLKIVNNEGYHDRDNFTEIPSSSDSLKILVAGDSFTWGASADVDSSYVDVFERDMKQAYPSVVWNTGIPATGTNHALFTTKRYLPLQKSNYVILGFYTGNDFIDNLIPFDKLVFNNLATCYHLYDYDKEFKPFAISQREAYKKVTGSYPIEELNAVQKLLIRSRVISFITDLKNKVVNRINGNKKRTSEQEYKVTKEYLKQLNEYTKENNAELIVYVIPTSYDVKDKSKYYLNAVEILKELGIKYIDNDSLVTQKDYVSGGGHWSNSGHIKAGHLLSKYLSDVIKEKQQKTFKK
jgi:hypothetical protein